MWQRKEIQEVLREVILSSPSVMPVKFDVVIPAFAGMTTLYNAEKLYVQNFTHTYSHSFYSYSH